MENNFDNVPENTEVNAGTPAGKKRRDRINKRMDLPGAPEVKSEHRDPRPSKPAGRAWKSCEYHQRAHASVRRYVRQKRLRCLIILPTLTRRNVPTVARVLQNVRRRSFITSPGTFYECCLMHLGSCFLPHDLANLSRNGRAAHRASAHFRLAFYEKSTLCYREC